MAKRRNNTLDDMPGRQSELATSGTGLESKLVYGVIAAAVLILIAVVAIALVNHG